MIGSSRAFEARGHHLGEVERRSALSPAEFRAEYLAPGKPVVLTGLTDHWPAREKWTFDFFRDRYGSVRVPVGALFETHEHLPLGEFVDYVERSGGEETPRCLSGWYFRPGHDELARDFDSPACMGPNWSERLRPRKVFRWGQEIMMGPAGSFTKLHRDGHCTHSWLAQIVGRKHWVLVAPEQLDGVITGKTERLGDYPGREHPAFTNGALPAPVEYTTAVIEPGEIMFVPSGWYHEVTALEACISLSNNFFNAGNVLPVIREVLLAKGKGLRFAKYLRNTVSHTQL